MQILITRLRKSLAKVPGCRLDRHGDGYRLQVSPDLVDVYRFRSLVVSARQSRDDDEAIALLAQALGLWRGPALADVAETARVEAIRAGLAEEHLSAVQDRFGRLLSAGRDEEAAAEIPPVLARHPLSERLAGMLMIAWPGSARTDQVVAGMLPRHGEWLPRCVQIAVAAMLADHRPAAELAYRLLKPYAGQCAVEGILAGSWGSVAAHLGLVARYLGRAEDADAHFAVAAELDAAAGAALAARTRQWAGGDAAPEPSRAVFRLDGEMWTLRYAGRTVWLRDSKGLRDLAVLLARPDQQTHVSELALSASDVGTPTERTRKAVTYRIRHALARVADAHPELGRHLRASVRTGTWCSYTPEYRVGWQR